MRTTLAQLEKLVEYLNKLTNSPMASYTKTETGYNANIGNYHLDGAYGGHKLVRMVSTGGGITDISTIGFASKSDLYDWIHAYIKGIEDYCNSTK
jgi:hypothetical protein